MSSLLKLRRGSTISHETFTGADGEVTFNTDTNQLVSHDGTTAGGFPHAKSNDLAASSGSTLVGHLSSGTGAVPTTVQEKLRESVSVLDFIDPVLHSAIRAGTHLGDLSVQVQKAFDTGSSIFFPRGTYYINISWDSACAVYGEGSRLSKIHPYNTALAAITQTNKQVHWSYSACVENLGFYGTGKVGVGFTFGKTDPTLYVNLDEYAGGISFKNCWFTELEKGIQFPFGNIGTEFYSCGFSSNYYGVYSIDNKFGGVMHAGNKYFYGGELSGNDCAIYIHNVTDGFGAVSLTDTIIEYNKIGIYLNITPRVSVPISMKGVWFENNGSAQGGSTTVDAWSGTAKTTQSLTNKSVIIDGVGGVVNQISGFAADIWLKGTYITYRLMNCRVEVFGGYGGGNFVVDDPSTSSIQIENPTSNAGWSNEGYIPYVSGSFYNILEMAPGLASVGRVFRTNPRSCKVVDYGPSLVASAKMTEAASLGAGSFNLAGTVVSDGRIYKTCNEFSVTDFTSASMIALVAPDNTVITTGVGYYVFTMDIKIVSGAGVSVNIWDRSTKQFVVNCFVQEIGNWSTIAAIGYSSGANTLFLDFRGIAGTVTWRASAYQMHKFSTLIEAQEFVRSNTYAES